MQTSDRTDVIAVAQPTVVRRAMAFVALLGMGCGALYIILTQQVPVPAKTVLIVLGALAFAGALWMRKTTAGRVELTAQELRDGTGLRIAAVADIVNVERGVFAFKPSNGFLVHTKTAQPRGWRMGVWWRFGRRVGIGGMMPVRQTKIMAEQIAMLIEKRDPPEDGSR